MCKVKSFQGIYGSLNSEVYIYKYKDDNDSNSKTCLDP